MRVVQSLAALAMLAGSAAAPLPALAAQPPRIVAQDCRALALSTSPSKIWQTSFYGERRDLWDNRDQRCESFSRGMKQKAALAGALIHGPRLMILDEPLTGLDAAAARQVKDLLRERTRQGMTVILTTHILDVAERVADRIGIIQKGQLLAEGTLEELRSRAGSSQSTLEDVFLQLVAPADA